MRLRNLILFVSFVWSGQGDAHIKPGQADRQQDLSRKPSGLPKEKYFHESDFHSHYDGRFADHVLDEPDQKRALRNLMRTYLSTFAQLGIDTWLVHGSLLGWWWNKQILPWDSDVDVMITESSLYYLAAYYNMSTFWFKTPGREEGRNYLLEINPNYKNREQTDVHNRIDARWVDTDTGLFIDITAARYNLTHPQGEGMMSCKDGHEFRDTYVFPLRKTTFEGVQAKIPYRFKDFLVSEYGPEALVNTDYHRHVFDDNKMRWLPKEGVGEEVLKPEGIEDVIVTPKKKLLDLYV